MNSYNFKIGKTTESSSMWQEQNMLIFTSGTAVDLWILLSKK